RGWRIPQAQLTRRRPQATHAHPDQPHSLLTCPDLLAPAQRRLGNRLGLVCRLGQGELASRRGKVGPADLELDSRAQKLIALELLRDRGSLLAQRALQRGAIDDITRK